MPHFYGIYLLACNSILRTEIKKLEAQLESAKQYKDEMSKNMETRNQKDMERDRKHTEALDDLEKQLKHKKTEISKLRQEMANNIAELEMKKDADLEQLEAKLRTQMSDAVRENDNLKRKVGQITPQLDTVKQDYR